MDKMARPTSGKEGFDLHSPPATHNGVKCDECGVMPITGVRFKCANCVDYDLCEKCNQRGVHNYQHVFMKLNRPMAVVGQPRTTPYLPKNLYTSENSVTLPTPSSSSNSSTWTVNVHMIEEMSGVCIYTKETKAVTLKLEKGGDTTVKEFIDALETADPSKGRSTIFDLVPFEEKILGEDSGSYGRHYQKGEWVPKHSNPRPSNCKWNPSREEPSQTIREAGLCDGADLAVIVTDMCIG